MNSSTRNITVIGVLIVVSLMALKLANQHLNEPTSVNTVSEKSQFSKSEEETKIEEGGEDEQESASPDPNGYARRIVHVPGSVDSEPLDSTTEKHHPRKR